MADFDDHINGAQLSPSSISFAKKDHVSFLALCLSLDIQAILTCSWNLGDFLLNNIAFINFPSSNCTAVICFLLLFFLDSKIWWLHPHAYSWSHPTWRFHPLVNVLGSDSSATNCWFWRGHSSLVALNCFLCWLYSFTVQSFSFTGAVAKWWPQTSLNNHHNLPLQFNDLPFGDLHLGFWSGWWGKRRPSLNDRVVMQTFFFGLHFNTCLGRQSLPGIRPLLTTTKYNPLQHMEMMEAA